MTRDKTNFKTETAAAIKSAVKTTADVHFVGSLDGSYSCTWEEFDALSGFTYDSGYGGNEVAGDLAIVFTDGSWLERGEYDGSEWWEHKTTPRTLAGATPITRVLGDSVKYAHTEDR